MKQLPVAIRRLLLAAIGLFFAAFLTFAILGICSVFTFSISAMASMTSLAAIMLFAGILQAPVDASLARRDYILSLVLVLCTLALLILKLLNLIA